MSSAHSPVKGLKDGTSMKTGHAAEHIRLTFEGMALEDDGAFEDYSIIKWQYSTSDS
jgi:hypothetical protein